MYFKAVLVKNEVVTTRPFDALLSLTSAWSCLMIGSPTLRSRTVPLALHQCQFGSEIEVAFCKNVNTTVLAAWPKPNFVSHFG